MLACWLVGWLLSQVWITVGDQDGHSGVRLGRLLESFGFHFGCIWGSILTHFGIIFGSILDHFGVILVHLDFGPPGNPLGRERRFGIPFWSILVSLLDPLGTPRETLGNPKGARRGPKALPREVSRGVQNQTPGIDHFGPPPGEAQVSSRLGESTVFTISPGSLLDPILAPFWHPFGTPGGHQEGRWRGWLAG